MLKPADPHARAKRRNTAALLVVVGGVLLGFWVSARVADLMYPPPPPPTPRPVLTADQYLEWMDRTMVLWDAAMALAWDSTASGFDDDRVWALADIRRGATEFKLANECQAEVHDFLVDSMARAVHALFTYRDEGRSPAFAEHWGYYESLRLNWHNRMLIHC